MKTEKAVEKDERIELTPGQVLWLDDPETMLQVSSGTVDVYAVVSDGNWQRRQVFLFEARKGQTLFGLPPEESNGLARLMILGPRGATLKRMTRSGMLAKAARLGEHILEAVWFMLEEWLEALLSAVVAAPPPRAFVSLGAGETVTVQQGQMVRPRKYLIWVQVENGDVRYGLMPDQVLTRETEFPLPARWWLAAAGTAGIRGLTTEEVFPLPRDGEASGFWQPLARCHQLFSSLVEMHFAADAGRESQRLAARQEQRDKLLRGAAVHLLRNDMPDLPVVVNTHGVSSPLVNLVKTIAVHLGIPEQEVRIPAGMDPLRQDGLMLRNIVRLAGMQVRQVCLEPGWHRRDNGPLLGYFGSGRQSVALLPVSPAKYRMVDAEGLDRGEVTEETACQIDHSAYVFYAGLRGKTVNVGEWLWFMLKKCWPGDILTIILASLAAGIIPILTPFVTQTIFDDIIPIGDRQGHLMVVQVMMVAAFATAGVSFARGIAFLRVKNKARLNAEAALWLRLLSLPAGFFRRYQAGDLAQRMNGVTQIGMLLSSSAVSTVFNLVFSFWSLLTMLYYSWQLTLAAVLVWVLYALAAGFLVWRLVAAKRRMTEAAGVTAGQVLQVFNGLTKFRMQGAEAQAFYLWARKFGEQWRWNRAARWRSNWLELLNTVQPVLLSMLVYWLTMHFLTAGDKEHTTFITQPEFLGFNAALGGLNAAVAGLVPVLVTLLDIIPLTERVRPILTTEPEVTDDKAEAGELTGQIEVNNVSFRYGPDRPLVLRNVSLNIQPGRFVAIVGGSGSGKSTLLRLLFGFEKPESGSVYFDGQDLAELNLASVRAQMGVVLQGGQLMAGDILTNIIGSLPLTLDDAWQAAEMVGLADDIRNMPMGMHTIISEGGANISGGQRQRILIARAIVNRPRIIIFDEATSALDNRTQAIVTESLDKLKATRVVVAHRLSTVINADTIYVMDKGQIVESGAYEELMDQNGLFAALAKRQML